MSQIYKTRAYLKAMGCSRSLIRLLKRNQIKVTGSHRVANIVNTYKLNYLPRNYLKN